MANEAHLRILLESRGLWNKWRVNHPQEIIDLSGADLRNADLSGVDLRGANLSRAILSGLDLSGFDLRGVNFRGADLRGADLRTANLRTADLSEANLSGADLRGADLRGANLSEATLSEANLSRVTLSRVTLSGLDLSNLDLSEADLSGANLSGTDLRKTSLIGANLDGATLTDASLWESQRAEWTIRNVICEVAYWDKNKQKRTLYQEGEFERLHAEHTKIVLHYAEGISPIEIATLPEIIRKIEEVYLGCALRLESIKTAAGGAIVTLILEDICGRTFDEQEALKKEIEKASPEFILNQRARLKEHTTHEEIKLDRKISHENIRVLVKERIAREKFRWELKILYENIIPRLNKGDVVEKKIIFNNNAPTYGNQTGDVSGKKATVNYTYADLAAIKALVSEMIIHRAELSLTSQQRMEFETQLHILKEQIATQSSNYPHLREGLRSLRHILEAGIAHGLVGPWLHTLQRFI